MADVKLFGNSYLSRTLLFFFFVRKYEICKPTTKASQPQQNAHTQWFKNKTKTTTRRKKKKSIFVVYFLSLSVIIIRFHFYIYTFSCFLRFFSGTKSIIKKCGERDSEQKRPTDTLEYFVVVFFGSGELSKWIRLSLLVVLYIAGISWCGSNAGNRMMAYNLVVKLTKQRITGIFLSLSIADVWPTTDRE